MILDEYCDLILMVQVELLSSVVWGLDIENKGFEMWEMLEIAVKW